LRGKAGAWNAIRAAARAPVVVFADADVRVDAETIPLLVARLAADPRLAVVGGRESAIVAATDGVAARVAALPYRFVFTNVPGRLYALRAAAGPTAIPASVLAEDAYLTVRLGRARFVKEQRAAVYFRPPATWNDLLADRVRNEIAKLQLARAYPDLLAAHGVSPYPWRAFLRRIPLREYHLVALSLLVRLYAHARARRAVRSGFPSSWHLLPSTKGWLRTAPERASAAVAPPPGVAAREQRGG
jgi:hypothetical protein